MCQGLAGCHPHLTSLTRVTVSHSVGSVDAVWTIARHESHAWIVGNVSHTSGTPGFDAEALGQRRWGTEARRHC
eukprot:10393884-Alexandrium_andersonii.AAC.1